MPDNFVNAIAALDDVAAYDGPWRPLRAETPLLRERLREIREREARLDDLLVIALVGGSGVGKSTLLNAIAGDQLAETSEFRPCTAVPTVFHPPGARLDFGSWRCVSGSALEHLIIIDTPDSDTIVREHRTTVVDVLRKCDLVVLCATQEKYLDEATWSLLRPLQGERTLVCVETKASGAHSVKDHWLGRLAQEGFRIDDYFRVSALRTLDRKLAGGEPRADEADWPRFESYLERALSRERIRRIKRSNAVGLMRKTITTLKERLSARTDELESLLGEVDAHGHAVIQNAAGLVRQNLFSEPHLWAFAFRREMALRAKGIVGGLVRLVEAVRSLPGRAAAWLPWTTGKDGNRHAAALLTGRAGFDETAALVSGAVHDVYAESASAVRLALARAEFDAGGGKDAGYAAFQEELDRRVAAVFRGPARNRLVRYATRLTSWPVTLLADLPPAAFLGLVAYRVVADFFTDTVLGVAFFVHAGALLALILGVELLGISLVSRVCAWFARSGATRDLYAALAEHLPVFEAERQAVITAKTLSARVKEFDA